MMVFWKGLEKEEGKKMEKVKSFRSVLCSLFICLALVLFVGSGVQAEQWDVSPTTAPPGTYILDVDTTVSVLAPAVDPDPTDDYEPRGYEPVPVLDSAGNQVIEIDPFAAVKVQASLTIPPDFPLPMQVRVVFGGPSFQSAPRQWTLRSAGEYSTSTYFTAGSEGDFKIGAQIWVRYLEPCSSEDCPILTNTNVLLDDIHVGPLQ